MRVVGYNILCYSTENEMISYYIQHVAGRESNSYLQYILITPYEYRRVYIVIIYPRLNVEFPCI